MRDSAASRRRWLIAGLGGVLLMILLLGLFGVPAAPHDNKRSIDEVAPPAAVDLAWNDNELLKEEVVLRDPTPLFLPTRWNASEDALALNAPREPGGSFQDYAPHFTFPETDLKLNFLPAVEKPAKPADAFAMDRTNRQLLGLGQTDRTVEPLRARGGIIQVLAAIDGQVMQEWVFERQPPEHGIWQPLEFLVAVDRVGVVRPPVLTESSQVAVVDQFFQDYLVNGLRIGERLGPGFYRVSIGP
ncbi:MAG TPA: hypothetical protein VL069_08685 [Opitutus sp.]|nr:hypothetical protein [Opitutus sp.]